MDFAQMQRTALSTWDTLVDRTGAIPWNEPDQLVDNVEVLLNHKAFQGLLNDKARWSLKWTGSRSFLQSETRLRTLAMALVSLMGVFKDLDGEREEARQAA